MRETNGARPRLLASVILDKVANNYRRDFFTAGRGEREHIATVRILEFGSLAPFGKIVFSYIEANEIPQFKHQVGMLLGFCGRIHRLHILQAPECRVAAGPSRD